MYVRTQMPKHTRSCLLVGFCSATGYTLLKNVAASGAPEFYSTDGFVATLEQGAAGGNKMFDFISYATLPTLPPYPPCPPSILLPCRLTPSCPALTARPPGRSSAPPLPPPQRPQVRAWAGAAAFPPGASAGASFPSAGRNQVDVRCVDGAGVYVPVRAAWQRWVHDTLGAR